MRAEGAAARRRTSLLLLLLLSAQRWRGLGAQGGLDPTVDGVVAGGEGETTKAVEVASYFTEFARQGPYPYQVCEELPGEIGDDPVTATARCIPVESGELEFCANVAYDACMRVISPVVYDEKLQVAHDERIGLWGLEFPELVTTECTEAFRLYFCLLSFPRCEQDRERPGTFLELPLCYDFCVNSHMACIGDPTLSVRRWRTEGRRGRRASRPHVFFFFFFFPPPPQNNKNKDFFYEYFFFFFNHPKSPNGCGACFTHSGRGDASKGTLSRRRWRATRL